ncbi:FeoA domain-containing protein [Caldithrix abyssi]
MKEVILVPNAEYVIKSLDDQSLISQRMIQMGVLPGSNIRIIRVGPLGKTVEVLVDQGESIALRTDELKALNCKIVALPLSAVKDSKQHYRIRNFLGGRGFLEKMRMRHLAISDIISISENDGFKLIKKDGQTVRIGRGEADKIIVEPVEQ